MSFILEGNNGQDIQINAWNWRPTLELLRAEGLLDDETYERLARNRLRARARGRCPRFTDLQDVVLASSASTVRPSTGRFLVNVTEKGTYTLFFENAGFLRTTPRRVFLDGEFKPD